MKNRAPSPTKHLLTLFELIDTHDVVYKDSFPKLFEQKTTTFLQEGYDIHEKCDRDERTLLFATIEKIEEIFKQAMVNLENGWHLSEQDLALMPTLATRYPLKNPDSGKLIENANKIIAHLVQAAILLIRHPVHGTEHKIPNYYKALEEKINDIEAAMENFANISFADLLFSRIDTYQYQLYGKAKASLDTIKDAIPQRPSLKLFIPATPHPKAPQEAGTIAELVAIREESGEDYENYEDAYSDQYYDAYESDDENDDFLNNDNGQLGGGLW